MTTHSETPAPGEGAGAQENEHIQLEGTAGPYACAAPIYVDLGWRGCIPVDPADKGGVPAGFTGRGGGDATPENVEWWIRSKPHHNVGLRLPADLVGLDVDAYGNKRGAQTLADAVARWGSLPPTYVSTSRDDGVSGIRLYRITEGVELVTDLGASSGVEIVQRHHRHVQCWPSRHVETGRTYHWHAEVDGGVLDRPPAPTDIPDLPTPWLDGLRAEAPRNGAEIDAGELADVPACVTPGDPSPRVQARLDRALTDCATPGERHNRVRDSVLALLRFGQSGEPGVLAALTTLRNVFVAYVVADGSRGQAEAVEEFNRMINRPRVAELLAEPGYGDWFGAVAASAATANGAALTTAATTGHPVDLYLEDQVGERMMRLRIDREAKRRLDAEERPQLEPPPVRGLDALLAQPPAPTRYRIDQVAPAGGRVLLSARYKAGKSTFSGNLVRSLVDGDPFLGRFEVHQRAQRLVLVDNELGDNRLQQWLSDQRIQNPGAVADVIDLRGRAGTFDLLDDRRRRYWATRLADLGCDYLILDCLRPFLDALGLDENREVGRFLTPLDALLTEAGIADATVIQHMGHSGERARGDSRQLDWPDAIWRLMPESDDPTSTRYFSAFGRDVDVPEGRLSFHPLTRHLTYNAGSRADLKTEAALRDLIALLVDKPGIGVRGIQDELKASGEHVQNAARAAIKLGEQRRLIDIDRSEAKHAHRIAFPCAECGWPVSTGRERHENCANRDGVC